MEGTHINLKSLRIVNQEIPRIIAVDSKVMQQTIRRLTLGSLHRTTGAEIRRMKRGTLLRHFRCNDCVIRREGSKCPL